MEIEDRQYLTVVDEMSKELENNVAYFNRLSEGLQIDKEALLNLRLRQYDVLSEMIERHSRVLKFHAGITVEPKAHFGEAVLLPTFGGGAG